MNSFLHLMSPNLLPILASKVNFQHPMVWGVIIGWIMTVVLHEFAHGIVAWWGGDYTIKERGGLTLNPFQYIDPVFSIILPIIFLAMGGIPLPGGVTYVRRDLLRNRYWCSAVSLAGPMMNFLIFLLCVIAIHPKVGWVDYAVEVVDWSTAQQFCATMAFLQIYAVLLNLFPIPPLDGFGAISPFLPHDLRNTLSSPQVANVLFIGYFLALQNYRPLGDAFIRIIVHVLLLLGIDPLIVLDGYNQMFK